MVRERSKSEIYHDARHEAAHVVAALYFEVPVAYATLTNTGGAVRMASRFDTYQDEIQYVTDHAQDYAVIYMAGKAYERLAGTLPARIAVLTEADHHCAKEYLQKQSGDPDVNSTAIAYELEVATERATKILADNAHLWDALTDRILAERTIRWETIKQIAIEHNP
jgi:ATP-dependent Zn protease